MRIGSFDYARCSKSLPCPICGRIKYCMVCDTGDAVVCTRNSEGSVKTLSYGFLHFLQDSVRPAYIPKSKPVEHSPDKIKADYNVMFRAGRFLSPLADQLQITVRTLIQMKVRTDSVKGHWCFPMYDQFLQLIGLKCRNLARKKWCVKGSRLGIYMSTAFIPTQPLVICEGESDTAALLNLGYNVIGRASATSCVEIIAALVRNPKVFIVADTDSSGIGLSSAKQLAARVENSSIIYNADFKDVREWIASGTFTPSSFLEHTMKE